MDLKAFTSTIAQIAEEKGIEKQKIINVIEQAIAAAYKKDYGKRGQIIKAKLNPKTGEVKFWQVKLVVDEDDIYSEEEWEETKNKKKEFAPEGYSEDKEGLQDDAEEKVHFNLEKHIMIKDAKKINPKVKAREDLEIILETRQEYGRIAAQTAKQVILQRLKEVERETVLNEYKDKEGEIISGIVQRIEDGKVFFDLGKILGVLPREEQIPGEFYKSGQRFRLYVMKVEDAPRGALIILSRSYPKFLSKLFELEVPEIQSEDISIKSIAREAGSRSKVAVDAETDGMDPIGAMVGQKGTRVMAVINELGGEKIDIIEYSENSEKYIANALSPAKVIEVKIMPKNKARVLVPEEQISLAIGKEGQNVRLAAQLTGWKIDVRSPEGEKGQEEEKEKEKKTEKVEEEKEEKQETKSP